jgi:hypothetical protein
MMKSTLDGATAVLRGFASWFSGHADSTLPDARVVPTLVSACEPRIRPRDHLNDEREFAVPRDRWAPGLSLDNFS